MMSQRDTDIKSMPCAIRESKKKPKTTQTLNYWLREY